METPRLGIDFGKSVFHLVGFNAVAEGVVRKKRSHEKPLHFTGNLRVERIGMEAWALTSLAGHSVRKHHDSRVMPAEYVKPRVHRPLQRRYGDRKCERGI